MIPVHTFGPIVGHDFASERLTGASHCNRCPACHREPSAGSLLQAKSQLELALKPKADRNAAAQGTALQEALETADVLLASRTGGVFVTGVAANGVNGEEETASRPAGRGEGEGLPNAAEAELCITLEELGSAARAQLQEEAAEQVCDWC